MTGWKECEEGEKSERNEEEWPREKTDRRRNGVTGEELGKIRCYHLKEIELHRQGKGRRLKLKSKKQKPGGVDNTLRKRITSDGEETRPPSRLSKARRSMAPCRPSIQA